MTPLAWPGSAGASFELGLISGDMVFIHRRTAATAASRTLSAGRNGLQGVRTPQAVTLRVLSRGTYIVGRDQSSC